VVGHGRIARYTVAAATITLAPARCQEVTRPDSVAGPVGARSTATLIQHIIAPSATDRDIDYVPAVNPELNHHYVLLDPSAHGNPKLLVFLPGNNNQPVGWQLLEQEAARLGYHVIGLMYQNDVVVVQVCGGSPDPGCSGNLHLEVQDGIDRSSLVTVTPANGVDNRLTKILVYLDAHYPDEGWSRFLKDGAPKWSQITISGQSQGAAQAALIGKLHRVSRVAMVSGPPDARVPEEADRWVFIGLTPAARYFALFHDRDHLVAGIRLNLAALDLLRFGDPVQAEVSQPPYGGTHVLFTDLRPTLGYARPNPHQSPAKDTNTPLGPDGTPLLRDAWRYLLGARDADEQLADDHDEQNETTVRDRGGARH
jgi:hypothetical protein